MATSRKRTNRQTRKTTTGSTKQNTKGRTTLAILFGAFGLLVPVFAGEATNWLYMLLGALVGAIIGYFMGKTLEKEVTTK